MATVVEAAVWLLLDDASELADDSRRLELAADEEAGTLLDSLTGVEDEEPERGTKTELLAVVA